MSIRPCWEYLQRLLALRRRFIYISCCACNSRCGKPQHLCRCASVEMGAHTGTPQPTHCSSSSSRDCAIAARIQQTITTSQSMSFFPNYKIHKSVRINTLMYPCQASNAPKSVFSHNHKSINQSWASVCVCVYVKSNLILLYIFIYLYIYVRSDDGLREDDLIVGDSHASSLSYVLH